MSGRWRAALKGHRVQPGRWDVHVMFADAFGWSQQQVDAMDPDYAIEVLAFLQAKRSVERER